MIENVLQHQFVVFEDMISSFRRQLESLEPDNPQSKTVNDVLNQMSYDKTIETLRQRWRLLDQDADRVEKSVSITQPRPPRT